MSKYELPIHFENPEGLHEISTKTLFEFLHAYKAIAKEFGLEIDITIGVPSIGGWKAELGLLVLSVLISPTVALLTGYSLDELGKKAHHEIVEMINEYINKESSEINVPLPKECVEAKNRIFEQLQRDQCVVGFRFGDFPAIPRANFHLYIERVVDEKPIYRGQTKIIVSSPDWLKKRSWRGMIEIIDTQERSFDFEMSLTRNFWQGVLNNLFPLHTADVMQVQLIEYPSRKIKYSVARVLSYNNIEIDKPIPEELVNSLFVESGPINPADSRAQKNLFDLDH